MNQMQSQDETRSPDLADRRGREMAASPVGGGHLDYAKVAWNARYLLALGTLIGLAVGYFHFTRQPAMYRSAAQVQIVESLARNLPVDGLDTGLKGRNLGDEAIVMRSEQILRRAAELGELSTAPEFAGMAPEQIAAAIGDASLSIGSAGSSIGSSVFQIQFNSTSPSTSQRVVQAVTDAYASHLKEQFRNVGQETIDLIQTARNDVLAKLDTLEGEFSDFKKSSGLIYRGNDTTSIHRDNADRFMAQRQDLLIQKAKLSSLLSSTRKAMEEEQPYEAILMALNSSFQATDDAAADFTRSMSPEQKWELEKIRSKPLLNAGERMRQESLLPLQLERESLVDTVGRDHPAIDTINKRIALIEKTIEKVEENEKRLNAELDEAMKAAAAEASSFQNPDEDLEPRNRAMEQVRFAVGALRQEMDALDSELTVVSDAYEAEMTQARAESDSEIRSAQFVREIDRQQQLYDRIVARLDEVNLMSGGDGLKVFPLNTAKLGYQFAPSMPKSLILGGLLGGMLAFGLALLREMSDRSYHSARDIAEHTRLPIIGHVPVLKPHKVEPGEVGEHLDSRLVTFFSGKGQKAEAFRAIRTAIYFSNQSGNNQVLQMTSSTPSDGKSTIAANVAVAIAQSGRRVLLMDGDLRRPRVGKVMGIENDKGTAWAIEQCEADAAGLDDRIQAAITRSVVANLSVMTAGERPDNPSELLSSPNFDRLLNLLRKQYDMIIVDTPPLLAVSDPANLASRVDGVILVVRLRKNIKPAVAQATRMLETLDANVLGIVVNGVGSRAARGYGKSSEAEGNYNYGSSYQYGYGYSYGYSYGYRENNSYYEEDDKKKGKDRKKAQQIRKAAVVAPPTSPADDV
ncbi:polysaccharide biosynthesis tyrosine autokinase [Rubripirellula reticaptiva]|uniref:non-specific protein-tyrosine kinase n=1 Tax=Rubripirellula reticaptiva TaxID=2528013 RepID=A0A5C6F1H9_9BACT|nr:polysaccharide biosynthesis tyrosine autokinase [Rubripirellula reticaptiva]TWU55208.1 Tyrosine-protein kinase ptk [Rubripirellula reticaptiva]